MSDVTNTPRGEAMALLSALLGEVASASNHEEWAGARWCLHGAGRMAFRLGSLTFEDWKSFDDQADRLHPIRKGEAA